MLNVIDKIQSVFQPQGTTKDLVWMNMLTAMNGLDALVETRKRLEKIDFSDEKSLKSKIEFVLEIDGKTYQNVKKITHKYMNSKKINRELDDEIQGVVQAYQRQLFVLYAQFLEVYQNQTKVKVGEEAVNLILARLLNAAFIMAKWRYFDDQPAPVGMWATVHKVIKYAENLAIMNNNLFLYNFQFKETSLAAILKRGFMLDTLQKGNFSRLQIQLTDQILKIWATNPLIVNKYKQDRYHFFIALADDRGPERVRAIEKFVEQRYWKTTRLADLIEAYLCAADTGKSVTAFGLDHTAPMSVILKLFKKLRTEWCVEGYARQRRKEVRNKSHKLLNISHGLHQIHQRLYAFQLMQTAKATTNEDFSFELKSTMQSKSRLISSKKLNLSDNESWWLVDESENGLAVDLGKDISNWVEVGRLVGYTCLEESGTFFIAEIKSVRKQKNGTYRVGLELITDHGVALQVLCLDTEHTGVLNGYHVEVYEGISSHFKTAEAILVKHYATKPSLLMPRIEYKRNGKYRINIDSEDKTITAGRIISKHRDWVHAEIVI